MLKKGDLLNIGYYDYGQYFTGSLDGLRFRLGRDPLEKVNFTPKDKRGEAKLKLTVWPEPFSFDHTEDDKKKDRYFDYTSEGLDEAVEFLNNVAEIVKSGKEKAWEQ